MDDYSITMSGGNRFEWQAEHKSQINPYICVSKCQRGYNWYPNIAKCLMVVPETDLERKR